MSSLAGCISRLRGQPWHTIPSKTWLDQGREAVRLTPYAMRTKASYITWITRYMRFRHTRQPGELSSAAIETFLTPLAFE